MGNILYYFYCYICYLNIFNQKSFKMSKQVRSKFVCTGVQDFPENENKSISFSPVVSGSEENKSFAKYTPSGSVLLNVSYETEASNFFEQGKEYYLDFTPAED